MSRIDYSDDEEFPGEHALWWANTERLLKGRRGQALLREMEAALLALPAPRLIADRLATTGGEVCGVGALLLSRQVALAALEEHDEDYATDAAQKLAPDLPYRFIWAVVNENDQGSWHCHGTRETPEQRFVRMRAWVRAWLSAEA